MLPPHSEAWDESGGLIRCASDVPLHSENGSLIYVGVEGAPWQWAPEWVGHVRTVRVPVEPLLGGEPGIPELEDEVKVRLQMQTVAPAPTAARWGMRGGMGSGGGDSGGQNSSDLEAAWLRLTLETLSASPPLFRVRGLLSKAEVAVLKRHAQGNFEPSVVSAFGAQPPAPSPGRRDEGDAEDHVPRMRDSRRTSSSYWMHGYNDPRHSVPAARALQRRAAALLRLRPRALTRQLEPLLLERFLKGEVCRDLHLHVYQYLHLHLYLRPNPHLHLHSHLHPAVLRARQTVLTFSAPGA